MRILLCKFFQTYCCRKLETSSEKQICWNDNRHITPIIFVCLESPGHPMLPIIFFFVINNFRTSWYTYGKKGFWIVFKVLQNNINQFIAEWNNICIFAIVIWKMSYLWCMNGDKSTDICHPYITNISCSNGASPCQAEIFSVPSLFHKAIFSFEKHLYDVLKKSVANLEMCEIRVNTHILTGIPRALIYLFSKRYARTETLFSGVFRPFPYSYVLFLSTFKLNDVWIQKQSISW